MKTYKPKMREDQEIISITCDVCNRVFDIKNDQMEIQEFHYIGFIGGYNSVFGDGNSVKCDICQHCLKEILGKYLIVE